MLILAVLFSFWAELYIKKIIIIVIIIKKMTSYV